MSFKTIPFGTPEKFNVVLEIPKGSHNKYEYDEKLDEIRLDFVFTDGWQWPVDYGYIPETRGGDGDHLDAMVLSSYPIEIGTIVECRPIGMIELLDRGEEDNKIIAVPVVDLGGQKYQSMKDLSQKQIEEFRDAFKEIARQKKKVMEVKDFHDKDRAIRELEVCRKNYKKTQL